MPSSIVCKTVKKSPAESLRRCRSNRTNPPSWLAFPSVVNSSKATLMSWFWSSSRFNVALIARTSDCPCVPSGHFWLCLDQFEVLSRTKITLGRELAAAPLARPLAKRSMSSARVSPVISTKKIASIQRYAFFIGSLLFHARHPCLSAARGRNQIDRCSGRQSLADLHPGTRHAIFCGHRDLPQRVRA